MGFEFFQLAINFNTLLRATALFMGLSEISSSNSRYRSKLRRFRSGIQGMNLEIPRFIPRISKGEEIETRGTARRDATLGF